MSIQPVYIVLLAALTLASTFVRADFDSDVARAYAPYRAALFKSNKKDQKATLAAIGKFLKIWEKAVIAGYPQTPAKYAGEADWPAVLVTVKDIAKQARTVAQSGDVAEAHEVLEAIRDQLDALRMRNGVRVFSSFVNAYHTEMEHLFHLKVNQDTWSPQLSAEIREQLGVLGYLAKDMAVNSPEANRANPEFNKLLNGVNKSIAGLREALNSDNPQSVAKSIKSLKPAYAKLFVKFG